MPDTPTVYLASYKSTHAGWQGLVNRAIRWLTKSTYSHSEVCVGHPFAEPVPCLSSSGVDGGVRIKIMQLSPDKWDVQPMQWVKPQALQAFYERERGHGFDYLGVTRFLLPWLVGPSKTRWFCTEVAACVAGYPDPWRFAPADFQIIVSTRNQTA